LTPLPGEFPPSSSRPDPTIRERRVAVVTGAGGGIGSATARGLAAAGHDVVLVGRTAESLEQVAADLNRDGGRAVAFPADVRNWERLGELAAMLERDFGRCDVLVNSAGGQFHAAAVDITPRGWAAVLETNLTGTFFACRRLFPLLCERGGAIVNVVANVWQRAAPRMAHSGAARAGVVNLTRTLALEWAQHGIRVNCVSPGLTDTPGLRSHTPDLTASVARVPLRRAADAGEVGALICMLAGPDAGYVTGEVLVVDGGLQLV
jgi:citronellol/citronellal dehydrogenase